VIGAPPAGGWKVGSVMGVSKVGTQRRCAAAADSTRYCRVFARIIEGRAQRTDACPAHCRLAAQKKGADCSAPSMRGQ